MEESEWEIQQYSSYDDKTSIVKWMLINGYVIGKDMVITGIAISVVPPLVVFSAMGFAFSLPFGLGFVTYACTNKIMTTLLPIPPSPSPSPSPLMLEYYTYEYEQEKSQRFEVDDSGDDYRQIDGAEISYFIDECDDGGGEVEDLVTNVDADWDEERYYIGELGNEEDEIGLENAVEEEDNEQMEDLNQGVDVVIDVDEGGDDYGKQEEALIMNVDENVDEESNHPNENVDEKEMENHASQRENVVIEEEENEQMEDIKQDVAIVFELNEDGDDYGQQGQASIINVAENVDEDIHHANENVDERELEDHVLQQENVFIEEKENEQMEDIKQLVATVFELNEGGDDYGQQGEASIMNVDEIVDEEIHHANENVDERELEDYVLQRENVFVEQEEKEQMEDINQGVDVVIDVDEGGDDYGKQEEALIMNVDENVDEESHHANENVGEKEMEDHVPRHKNVVIEEEEIEQVGDIKQAVAIVFELNEGGDDYGQQGQASVINVVENVDEEIHHANENIDERELEDHMLQRENVFIKEEGKEQMEDIKQGDAIVFELNEDGDDYGKQGEALIMNMDENVDEKSNRANENVDEKEMEDHVLQRENVLIEEEEREQMEDLKQGVEMRLGLDESGEDQGYEEDVGEYLEGDDDSFEDERKVDEPLVKSQINENTSNTQEVTEDEKEEKVEGSSGLLENRRDEDNINNAVEDDYLVDESALVFEDASDVDRTEPVIVKEIDSPELIMNGSTNNETVVGEMRHIVILAEGNEENNFNAREVEELDLVAREVMGDPNRKARNTQSDEEVMRESMGTREEETGGYTSNDGSEEETEHLIHSYADAREIGDESGLDLFDERNANIQFTSLEADDEGKENFADENVDFLALPAFKRLPLTIDNGKAASKPKTNTKMPSREDTLDEARIWEKIGAMRSIVGYKIPSQPTCIGELKALYVFTGVEPPASFKDDSDLDEANAKLKFLMSIVGVK